MNNFAKYLNMENTTFINPHGLSDTRNKSSSNDIAKLCFYAMKNEQFREIVNTREHEALIFNKNTKLSRTEKWVNTNKLLDLEHC
jgi:D-alanyl-D-alanine carboxypeptidase (penicillin-binding protein 5/6)